MAAHRIEESKPQRSPASTPTDPGSDGEPESTTERRKAPFSRPLHGPQPAQLNELSQLSESPRRNGWRTLRFPAFLVLLYGCIFALHGPYKELPFWGDSLGYMTVNTRYMADNHTIFGPKIHDPGHPPLTFLTLWAFWTVFGRNVVSGHLYQWFWTMWLAAGMAYLGYLLAGRWRLAGFFGAVFALAHPHFFGLANSLLIEIPMTAFLVWMLYGFYGERPWVFTVSAALLMFSKLNAVAPFLAFAIVELGLFPLIRLVRSLGRPEEVRALWRWWVKWTGLAALATLPLLIWLPIHRLHQGFWVQSPLFAITTHMTFDKSIVVRNLERIGPWAIWYKEGNRDITYAMGILLVCGLVVAVWRRLRGRMRRVEGAPEKGGAEETPAIRRPVRVIISLALQGALTYGVYVFKKEDIIKYYTSIHALFPLGFLTALGFVRTQLEGTSVWRTFGRRAAVQGVAALLCTLFALNYFVRLRPEYADRIPFLGKQARNHFRNDNPPTYIQNLQIVRPLWTVRKMVRWLEARSHESKKLPIIVAVFPFDITLSCPEAGYLRGKEPLRVARFYSNNSLLKWDWDYMIKQDFQLLPKDMPNEEVRKARGVTVRKVFGGKGVDWNFQIEILEPKVKRMGPDGGS